MMTNQDRINYLREKVKQLNVQIQEKNLENKYIKMLKQTKEGKLKLTPIDEEEWGMMLPKEQEKNLLTYYHTVRSELTEMKTQAKEQGRTGRLKYWLSNPWVKIGLTAVTLTEVAIKIAEVIAHSGLFFSEDNEGDYLV